MKIKKNNRRERKEGTEDERKALFLLCDLSVKPLRPLWYNFFH